MTRLVVLRAAQADIRKAALFYKRQASHLGTEFTVEVENALSRVAGSPETGSPMCRGARNLLVRHFPYPIICRVEATPMAKSSATTAEAYLAELPEERRAALSTVRELILRHLPAGYVEAIRFGMLSYEIPLERYPTTYNRQPLAYAALAAQKNYFALYLTGAYVDPEQQRWLEEQFRAAGKRMDMGKSCLHFRSPEDLPLESIGQLIASTAPERFIERYEASRQQRAPNQPA